MSEVLVKVENVSKKFSRDLKKSLWYGVKDMGTALFTNQTNHSELRPSEFWAVKNVSFELRRGECLGLIGHNGAGKSTLLKILNGLIRPDKGKITMHGRIGALIELGAGFNPILTGRENIYNNGAILGFSKKDIDEKLDQIVEFSEIGDFIDTPVQNYSSGMKVRLGFAVASQMDPDVLIIDEVLAVGDVGFQGKCMHVISDMLKKAAVIFVSHSMPKVQRYCSNGLLLNKGEIEHAGDVEVSINKYFDHFKQEKGNSFIAPQCKLNYLKLDNEVLEKDSVKYIEFNSAINFEISFSIPSNIEYPDIRLLFLNQDLMVISTIQTPTSFIVNNDGNITISVKVFPIIIKPGKYKLSLNVSTKGMKGQLLYYEAWWPVEIKGNLDFGSNFVVFNSEWKQGALEKIS